MRTAVRVISTVTVVTALGLIGLNRSYVQVYATSFGQVVLAGIAQLGVWRRFGGSPR